MTAQALPDRRRRLTCLAAGALAASALLAGCGTLAQLGVEVSSFGDWPAGRAPGSYAFDRLPSQQAQADSTRLLEAAAAPALAAAGFRPVAEGAQPDVLVQLGARVSRSDRSPWDDPLWWRGGYGSWRYRPWHGPHWGATLQIESERYDREAALLIRDRASGQPLYEARASSQGFDSRATPVLKPLFAAALIDFPRNGPNPRQVRVPMGD